MRRALGWTAVGLTAAAVPLVTANTYYLYLAMTVAIFVVVTCGLNVLAGLYFLATFLSTPGFPVRDLLGELFLVAAFVLVGLGAVED